MLNLQVELPDLRISATLEMYDGRAPRVCRAIWDVLSTPLETTTQHACFDGHEIYCFLPAMADVPPIENKTMRPRPGEVMFFHAAKNDFAVLDSDRLAPGTGPMFELAFMYGEVDLRHLWEEGLHGSLVGRLSTNADKFADAAGRTLNEGATSLRISRLPR
ncbi:DUF3830 family protein [Phycicoccus sp. Soil803]|uniref:DUF3830 family protein n=1 Tax=Phycicoccus sp. Soil803 TaxID=1736415 RepID=UPI00070DE449|nr:DUF3830 family protein [Phycicoccus sp. Soil803]KRF26058.1 hypothetical protein ASG95_17490 [Phycicoccus sp. Soil803]